MAGIAIACKDIKVRLIRQPDFFNNPSSKT